MRIEIDSSCLLLLNRRGQRGVIKLRRKLKGNMENRINWDCSRTDAAKIDKIAKRAVAMAQERQIDYDKMTARMDVMACHLNGNPLDLDKLLGADDFNFSHDVFGIARHINRSTGKLENFFVPRCSMPERETVE